jgi:hypothetical protein
MGIENIEADDGSVDRPPTTASKLLHFGEGGGRLEKGTVCFV